LARRLVALAKGEDCRGAECEHERDAQDPLDHRGLKPAWPSGDETDRSQQGTDYGRESEPGIKLSHGHHRSRSTGQAARSQLSSHPCQVVGSMVDRCNAMTAAVPTPRLHIDAETAPPNTFWNALGCNKVPVSEFRLSNSTVFGSAER
jgi:hypothetical protein